MMKYDFTFLLANEAEVKTIKELVKTHSGKVEKEEAWGKKTLAYPIKKNSSAFYYNWQIEMTEKDITEFKRKLDFTDSVMRYLVLKVD